MKASATVFSVLSLTLLLPAMLAAGSDSQKLRFNRDIRPILSENCFACHGPDKGKRKAKLRLDQREAALEKEAFKPGDPEHSELVKRIFATSDDDVMPPPDSRKKLTDSQRQTLKRWIGEGAEYQPHWSYIKPARLPVPAVKAKGWGQNPIDAFILRELEQRQLAPAARAEKAALLRRVSLDLIGLPPTPSELDSFLKDRSAAAYKTVVQRLLKSPHFGERMAVPWLDVARFTDTVGYHGDQGLNDFPYRDYVIDAFNANKPFDQFTIEQLAGDLLPHPTPEQLTATGFNRLNMVTREGGAQPNEYLAKYGADRVRTVSMAWLGSTMGCAECHDHKFDPFSTRDFYTMKAFFADIKEWGVYQDYNYTPNPDLKGWSNDHPFPPELTVESAALKGRIQRARDEIGGLGNRVAATRAADVKEWRAALADFLKVSPTGWRSLAPAESSTNLALRSEGAISLGGANKASLSLSPGWIAAVRLELLPDPAHEGRVISGKAESATITFKLELEREGTNQSLSFFQGDADHKAERYFNGSALAGIGESWRTAARDNKTAQGAIWLLDPPILAREGDRLLVNLGKAAAGVVRISVTPLGDPDPLRAGDPAVGKTAAALGASLPSDPEIFSKYKTLAREVMECTRGEAQTVIVQAVKPRETRVLPRGNWQDETGEVVSPAPPHFLPQIAKAEDRRLNRLDLARWMVSPENPLTARVIVNRLWKQFFGAGLSAVVDDLGAQGEWPTHPELLDWLAVEFMESGWNIKHIVELMVTSATYQQSSNASEKARQIDPANQWLSCQRPRRLEAEFVRDNALAISGLLNGEIGGPSAHPYQPAGYYANLQFPDREYRPDTNKDQYRRGVYTHWQRTFLHPMLVNFDAPAREECVAIRNVSNSPQQALTLLNDPTFVEAARAFANTVLKNRENDDRRLDRIYLRALARKPKPGERASLKEFLAAQREHAREHSDEAPKFLKVGLAPARSDIPPGELAAWTEVCRVVLNLHETITRY